MRTTHYENDSRGFSGSSSFPFTFLATARHVAQKLEGKKFALRVNRLDGTVAIINGNADTRWWYHPTEPEYIDAALAMFMPENLQELDIQRVHTDWFADEERIEQDHIGAGDEVFIAGILNFRRCSHLGVGGCFPAHKFRPNSSRHCETLGCRYIIPVLTGGDG
jgi:hypothetical protein